MPDEELDQFFQELQMKSDLENFIQHNQYPSHFRKTSHHDILLLNQQYPAIDENIENHVQYNDNYYNDTANSINKSISKCYETIKTMTENKSEPEPETCPICMCVFEESNYVIPRCRHKVCAVCFTNNIKHNKHTGDCCVLCRERVC